MYEQSYKSIIAKAKKMSLEGLSGPSDDGLMPKPKKKKDNKEEDWEDIAAWYVLSFHKRADSMIKDLHQSTKKEKK